MPKALSKRVSDFFHSLDKNSNVAQPLTEKERSLAEKHPILYKYASLKRTNDRLKAKEHGSFKYRPWSKADFLARLSTYSYRIWNVPEKLTKINPVECSKHGWSCYSSSGVAKNTIRCASCGGLIRLNLGDNEDLYENLEIAYSKMLQEEHKKNCPWREKWCNDDIYEISPHEYWKNTKARYRSLENSKLENEDYTEKEEDTFHQAENMLFSEEERDEINKPALKFALKGWKLVQEPSIVKCQLCFSTVDGSQSGSINQHRTYCPFNDFHPSNMSSQLHINEPGTKNSEASMSDRIANLRKIYFSNKT